MDVSLQKSTKDVWFSMTKNLQVQDIGTVFP